MKKSEIKVGQKVKVVEGLYPSMVGMIGEVVRFSEGVLCKFPGWKGGHSGGVEDDSTEYWLLPFEDVTPVVEYTTKYKAGDVVTVRSDLTNKAYYMADGKNYMTPTDQMFIKRGQKVKIKSVTKTGKYMIEGSIFPWVDEMFVDESKVEPKCKFKVGDKVVVVETNIERLVHGEYNGTIGEIVNNECRNNFWKVKMFDGLELWSKVKAHPTVFDWELIIRGEGDKTIAEYIVNDVKTTAEVHRFHEDQYSVRKAVEFVTNKVLPEEKWVVGVKFDKGEKVYNYYTTDNTIKAGDKVVVPVGEDNHHVAATVVDIKPESEVLVALLPDNMKYVDRKCTEEDTPKYYNGKVVCVKTHYPWFTVGKIYEVKDGILTTNYGETYPNDGEAYRDAEDVRHAGNGGNGDNRHNPKNEFIPIVE